MTNFHYENIIQEQTQEDEHRIYVGTLFSDFDQRINDDVLAKLILDERAWAGHIDAAFFGAVFYKSGKFWEIVFIGNRSYGIWISEFVMDVIEQSTMTWGDPKEVA